MIVKSLKVSTGEIVGKEFWFPIRIYWEDTDAEGIVYFANYLKFAERTRTELLRYLGCCQNNELNEKKTGFVVQHLDADYLAPAYLDDELLVSCSAVNIGGASITLHQEIKRGNDVLTRVNVKAVYLDLENKKPTRIPKEMAQKLESIL